MKKFTKLFLSCAVVSAMAMSATAAFAELPTEVPITGQVTGTYTVSGASVAITNFVQTGDTLDTTKPATYLVVKGDDKTEAAQSNIAGIDQVDTASATLTGAKTGLGNNNVTAVTDGMTAQTYTVYVGYYNTQGGFKVSTGSFTLTDGSAPAVETMDLTIGDVNIDNKINGNDQTMIMRKVAGLDETKQLNVGKAGTSYVNADEDYNVENVIVGDVNLDGKINGNDQTMIMRKVAGLDETKQLNVGQSGKTITVEKPAE